MTGLGPHETGLASWLLNAGLTAALVVVAIVTVLLVARAFDERRRPTGMGGGR